MLTDATNKIKTSLMKNVVYEDLWNEELVSALDKNRDIFINTYSNCYSYKSYFPDLIDSIEKDHNEDFISLTSDINSVIFILLGIEYTVFTYSQLWNEVGEEIDKINIKFIVVLKTIDNQIV